MKQATIEHKYKAALKALGNSFASIERELLRRKIVGVPEFPYSCVLAMYFAKATRLPASVGRGFCVIDERMFGLPQILTRFVDSFDAFERHPKLYPQPEEWTPPINGWQYRMHNHGGPDWVADESCPVRLFFREYNGRGEGWRVKDAPLLPSATAEGALAKYRARGGEF